jgi:energy-coupling factor transporter ATP-binding protein EcfA2
MTEPVYFLKLELSNYRCFKNTQVLHLSDGNGNWKKWTLILGNNGTGKSSLIELLAGAEIEEEKTRDEITYTPIGLPIISKTPILNESSHGYCKIGLNIYYEYSDQFGDEIEFFFEDSEITMMRVYHDERLKQLKCFGYGANRSMSVTSLSESKSKNSETLFIDDAKLINAEEWLLQLDYAASKESTVKEFAKSKREQVKQILIDLLPDVEEIRFTIPTKKNLKSTIEFKTPFGWITIHQLSLGYKAMVSWLVDLTARLFERYPDSDNPLAEPAIVLVDEIDLHLHPKWQRKIFDYLSEKFPQTQFIVTAHSPLVVQSAPKDANIVVLRREGDHVVIDNDVKSVRNWRLDQILSSDLFGIESARDPETEKWLQERTTLLQKKSLSPAEKARLDDLNNKAANLPTADTPEDIEAMEIIRKAADYLKNQKA